MTPRTFNALGIFGRLDSEQEAYLLSLQRKYAPLSETSDAFGIFPHLTVVAGYKVPSNSLEPYTAVVQKLTTCIPLMLDVTGVRIIGRDIALSFNGNQTQPIRELADGPLPDQVIMTDYFTVIREAPKASQQKLVGILGDIQSLTFTDFKLCADRVDEAHLLKASSRY